MFTVIEVFTEVPVQIQKGRGYVFCVSGINLSPFQRFIDNRLDLF